MDRWQTNFISFTVVGEVSAGDQARVLFIRQTGFIEYAR